MNQRLLWMIALLAIPEICLGALWIHGPENPLPGVPTWSNKAEVADLNEDGWPDILFANGRGYASPQGGERNQVLLNPAGNAMPWNDVSNIVFGKQADQSRAIKVRDLTGDGKADIFVANTYQNQSRLYVNKGTMLFLDETNSRLPQSPHSFGDAEAGDIDGDGDLDLILADWGPGNPMNNNGGLTRLWLNDGNGNFQDVTAERMPNVNVRFSWELELADVDNDFDLDVLVSCKSCTGSFLFHNDGTGFFTDASEQLPQFSNNYDFDLMDITGDGFLEAVTINDGSGLKEHLFSGNGDGGFTDATTSLWPTEFNVGADDNVARFIDADSDGDSDLFIGSLNGADRLLTMNDSGEITNLTAVTDGPSTPGTLDIVFADFNGDDRLDWVQGQGEVGDETNRIYYGADIPLDTASPHIPLIEYPPLMDGENVTFRCRIHDGQSSAAFHDGMTTSLFINGLEVGALEPMGGSLFHAIIPAPNMPFWEYEICAMDRAGNMTCSDPLSVGEMTEDTEDDTDAEDAEDTADSEDSDTFPEDQNDTTDTEYEDTDAETGEDDIAFEEEDAIADSETGDAPEESEAGDGDTGGKQDTESSPDSTDPADTSENENLDGSLPGCETTDTCSSDTSQTETAKDQSNADTEQTAEPLIGDESEGSADSITAESSNLGKVADDGCRTRSGAPSTLLLLLGLAYSFSRRLRTSPN